MPNFSGLRSDNIVVIVLYNAHASDIVQLINVQNNANNKNSDLFANENKRRTNQVVDRAKIGHMEKVRLKRQ